jgi:hypothetical protein
MHFARKIVASEAHEFGDLRCFLPFFNRALSCRPVSSFPKNIPGHLLSGGHLTIVPLDEISLGQSVHSHLQPGPRDRWGGSFNRSGLVVHWGVAPLDEKMKNLCGAWCGYIWYMIVCIYIKLYYILLYYIYIIILYGDIYICMIIYVWYVHSALLNFDRPGTKSSVKTPRRVPTVPSVVSSWMDHMPHNWLAKVPDSTNCIHMFLNMSVRFYFHLFLVFPHICCVASLFLLYISICMSWMMFLFCLSENAASKRKNGKSSYHSVSLV